MATASVRAQVNRVDRAYHQAVSRRDLSAVVGLYAPNAHLVPSNAPPAHGRAAIRRRLQATFRAGWCAFTFTPSSVTAGRSLLVAFGHYVSVLCLGHKQVVFPKRWAVLMLSPRRGGGLQIAYDIYIG